MIRTFRETSPSKLDELVNEFEKANKVFATQTNQLLQEGIIIYIATVFFRGE